jgi:hypothetical protein
MLNGITLIFMTDLHNTGKSLIGFLDFLYKYVSMFTTSKTKAATGLNTQETKANHREQISIRCSSGRAPRTAMHLCPGMGGHRACYEVRMLIRLMKTLSPPLVPSSLCKPAENEVWMCDPGDLMISRTCSSATSLINTPRRFVKSNQKHCRL